MLIQRQTNGTATVDLDRADVDAIEDALQEYSTAIAWGLGASSYQAHAGKLAGEFRSIIREWNRTAQSPVEPSLPGALATDLAGDETTPADQRQVLADLDDNYGIGFGRRPEGGTR